jgi:hypothetical protein
MRSLEPAAEALAHAAAQGPEARGPAGEPLRYPLDGVKLKAPVKPVKFFHTAGNFREHHEEASRSGFSHPRVALNRILSECGRHYRARRAGDLSAAPHRRARL